MSAMVNLVKSIPNFSSDKVETFVVPGNGAYINNISYYIPDERGTWDIVDEEFGDFKLKKWTEADSGLPESNYSSVNQDAPVNIFPKTNNINNQTYQPNYNENYNNNYNNNYNYEYEYEHEEPQREEPAKQSPSSKPSHRENKTETPTEPPAETHEAQPTETPASESHKEPAGDPGVIEYEPGLSIEPPAGGEGDE